MDILLADDHTMFRQGLNAFLSAEGFHVAAEAADGREASELAIKLEPDVAVLDLGMPVLSGIEVAKEIRDSGIRTKTVLLTMYDDAGCVVEALRAGVRGYVLKAQAGNELVHCIREAARGAIYLSPALPRPIIDAYFRGDQPTGDLLSIRERQVVRWIAAGKTTREIAGLLQLSPKTIESHRSRIMRKLGIHEIASLVRFAVRHHLADP